MSHLPAAAPEVRILSFVNHIPPADGIEEHIERAFEWGVDAVVAQGTGSDWGPYWLGSGLQVESDVARNVLPYVLAAKAHGVPFVFSFGIAGGDVHLDKCLRDFHEVCTDAGLDLDVAVIRTELGGEFLAARARAGAEIRPAGGDHLAPLTERDALAAERVVALIGPEPVQRALATGADGVITGRALDIGLFMAVAMNAGIPTAVAGHAAKLLECGGLALEPGDSANCVWARVDAESVEIRSPDPAARPTVASLVSHGFYERAHPYAEDNPGGTLDLGEVVYTELADGGVLGTGARWFPAPYTVLVEGATRVGYRAVSILGVRDPALLARARAWTDTAEDQTRRRYTEEFATGRARMTTRIFGLDAVLGELEPESTVTGHEASVIVDVVADSQELANQIGYYAFIRLFIGPYPGRKTTAGNAAAPYMPVVIPVGEVFTFGIYHLLPLTDPVAPFPYAVRHFGVRDPEEDRDAAR
jgi:acyclic terpene utilization AtuA family protein